MRIGLLPPLEPGCGRSAVYPGANWVRSRATAVTPLRLGSFEADVMQPAIDGGSNVDIDHQ